ncbi:LOW QUALITY PROTEIN: hypothetical protein HZS_8012 [Henneguya salminicola]|nr:LOW QUALITY PROTEIN: hypothetical protein HZS_8012 [Henneguya salminicola]
MLFEQALDENVFLNGFEQQFKEFLNYYETNFIRRHHRSGSSQPLVPIRLWNPSEKTENGISRTNNKVEGWHHAFARHVEGNYPNI